MILALGTEMLIKKYTQTKGKTYRFIQDIINVLFPYEKKLVYSYLKHLLF